MKRPNHGNAMDACCCCHKLIATPKDHEKPLKGELHVWQPSPVDPPQFICEDCKPRLEADARRNA